MSDPGSPQPVKISDLITTLTTRVGVFLTDINIIKILKLNPVDADDVLISPRLPRQLRANEPRGIAVENEHDRALSAHGVCHRFANARRDSVQAMKAGSLVPTDG
jgi:hypothetical protein